MAIVFRKRADGTLVYQVKVKDLDGNWFPTPTFESLESAEQEELRLKRLKRKGARAISDDARTVTELEFWEVWKVENRAEVSEGWKLSQDQMHEAYIAPVIGAMKMVEIKAPEIGRVLKRMADLGRGSQMRLHVYNLMNQMFSDAVGYYEMLSISPVKADFHKPQVMKRKRDFLLPGQAWKLLEASQDHYAGPAIWLETLAGIRNEVMHVLDWKDVIWELDHIVICRAFKRKVGRVEEYPKGRDWEYVPMIPALKKYLLELWLKRGRPQSGLVVLGPKGGMLIHATYRKALRSLCAVAQVPCVDPHELRHSCTEIWVQAGASQEDIGRLLNHKSDSVTRGYMHRTDARLTSIGKRIQVGGEITEVSQIVSQLGNFERVNPHDEAKHAL